MLDMIIYFLLKYTYVVTLFLFLIKTILFLKHRNKNWTVLQFIFFNPINIRFTSKNERVKYKRIQNGLSVAILLLIIIEIFSYLFF